MTSQSRLIRLLCFSYVLFNGACAIPKHSIIANRSNPKAFGTKGRLLVGLPPAPKANIKVWLIDLRTPLALVGPARSYRLSEMPVVTNARGFFEIQIESSLRLRSAQKHGALGFELDGAGEGPGNIQLKNGACPTYFVRKQEYPRWPPAGS